MGTVFFLINGILLNFLCLWIFREQPCLFTLSSMKSVKMLVCDIPHTFTDKQRSFELFTCLGLQGVAMLVHCFISEEWKKVG